MFEKHAHVLSRTFVIIVFSCGYINAILSLQIKGNISLILIFPYLLTYNLFLELERKREGEENGILKTISFQIHEGF